MKRIFVGCVLLASSVIHAQEKSLTNTSKSSYAKLRSVDMNAVQWTNGFWAERFQVCRDSMVPNMWAIYNDDKISHAFANFKIAAGLDTGSHKGPSFHDGDYYKTLEAVASLYAITKDKRLDEEMDKAIAVIGINSNVAEDAPAAKSHAAEHKLSFPILKDSGNKIADKLGAQVTPEAYFLDASNKLLYHGRIDNARNAANIESNDLRNALDAALAGKAVEKTEAKAFGCSIKRA